MQRGSAPWDMKRRLFTKAEEETDPKLGCRPEKRLIEDHIRLGMVNLDKTSGPSSHEVTAWVKRILHLRTAGHGGTLETLESGKSQGDWSFTNRVGGC
jgi:H/ACA ribonucleoprotein complex subunit 4